jgi:ureidoglycolate hydrolase
MISFENYQIRPLEKSDFAAYFAMVESNRKRLEDFFVGTVSRTKDLADTKIFLEEMRIFPLLSSSVL